MKVGDLIRVLKVMDPDAEVRVQVGVVQHTGPNVDEQAAAHEVELGVDRDMFTDQFYETVTIKGDQVLIA